MDLDPEGIFLDDSDSDEDILKEKEPTKEFVVYLVDASPKMFGFAGTLEDEKGETFFQAAINCISESLKSQIIGRSSDEVAICFFNSREKKNLQDLNGVYVFNVLEREFLDRPTARLIKEFSSIEQRFMLYIGSRYWIEPSSRDNSLYNALWVAQALLRKGSSKNVSKRILIFTNEDNPFASISGAAKADMIRTTLQRATDAQELGISIELLPMGSNGFDVSIFYADLIGLQGDELPLFLTSAGEKLQDMTNQLKKRMVSKRKVKTFMFVIANGISIEVNAYALIRPTLPGAIMWLDSITNRPLKTERSLICADTGAVVEDPRIRSFEFQGQNIKFTAEELSRLKKVSDSTHLRLLGFKLLDCLKDYHNLRPSTFLYPTDEEIVGSTCAFIALHRSMLRFRRFALAFYGSSSHPQLVALVAQDEIMSSCGQLEPPGMHMIYLPFSDDIRFAEELHVNPAKPHATDDQIKKASALIKRIDLKDFSVCQFANPSLQRHYGILQALALGEDEMPAVKDETLPDEEGMLRPGVVHAMEEFKAAVYGENHDQEEAAKASGTGASRKRKAILEVALKESANYDWAELAENGKLKDLTVVELKNYLTAHSLPVTGKKEALISRILTHLGK